MRARFGIAAWLVASVWPAASLAQPAPDGPESPPAQGSLEPAAGPAGAGDADAVAPVEPGVPPAPTPFSPDSEPRIPDPAAPGTCTLPAAQAIDAALERSDAGDAAADLDLAACWRLLSQPYPERVALARALERGLPAEQAEPARARLDALGGPPPLADAAASHPRADVPAPAVPNGDPPLDGPAAETESPVLAWTLGGVSLAGLLAGTSLGLASLYEHSRADAEVVETSRDEELGIAAGACAALGVAAGVAALLLWPDGETGPTAGPGDVGLGWEVRF